MKAGWITTTLDDACLIEYGTRVVQKKDGGSTYPVYGGGGATFYMDSFNRSNRLVVSRFGMSEQCTRFVKGDFFLNDSGLTISPKSIYPLSQFYLDKHLLCLNDQIFDLGKGSAQKNLDVPAFRQIKICFPENPKEQHRIVTLLDEAFADIATAKAYAEKNLQNTRELFESQRQLLLQPKEGWHEATLADLCNIKHGYAFEGEYFSDAGDHVLLTPGSFFETGGFRDRGEKTKYFTGPIPTDYVLNQGDLLVAMTEQAAGLLGSPLLVPESNRFLHNQRLGLVTGKPAIPWTNDFFFHVFNLEAVRKAIHASASGAKVRHTSPGKIGAVQVAFPDNQPEQLRIAAQVEEIEQASIALQSIYRQKLTALDDLKKSLLHQAFSGQL